MRIAATFVLAIALASSAGAQSIDSMLRGVRQMIDDGRASDALAALRSADVSRAGTRDRARIRFYEARAYEELGDEQKAIEAYTRATQIEPAYGAALNNLAQLLARRGETARAAALLKRATALEDDPRRVLYWSNYAALAEKAGQLDAARNAWTQVAAAQPDNVDAQLNAIRLLDDPRRMAESLTKLASRGEIGPAQSLALDLLRKPYDGYGKRALLGVVVATLASQPLDAAQASARLAPIAGDPLLRDGVAELLLLYRGTVDVSRYPWWRAMPEPRFGALIRSLGMSDPKRAEGYFKLALEYANGTDAEAFIELADLYYAKRRIADLDALVHRYEEPLFSAKSAAIASGDYAAEHRFHVALGTMYAYLERWGSENDPASAIFQLTQAERAAGDYNRNLKWGQKIPADPKTVELLANCYVKTNRRDRAIAVRIDHADAFLAEGRKTAAKAMLKAVDPNTITDPVYRQRHADVTKRLAQPIRMDTELSFPESVEIALKSAGGTATPLPRAQGQQILNVLSQYVLADNDAARDRAEATLRKLGVSDLNPTTMSRTTGELVVRVDGKPVKYVYSVRKRE